VSGTYLGRKNSGDVENPMDGGIKFWRKFPVFKGKNIRNGTVIEKYFGGNRSLPNHNHHTYALVSYKIQMIVHCHCHICKSHSKENKPNKSFNQGC